MSRINNYIVFFAFLFIIFTIVILFLSKNKDQFSCQSNVIIKNASSVFHGVINFNVSSNNGAVNINGFLKNPTKSDYIVNRTILFSSSLHGGTSVWESTSISISNTDTTPTELLNGILPQVYLEPSTISDVSIRRLDKKSFLLLKEYIPYVYCTVG
jgi:hypothetical protein